MRNVFDINELRVRYGEEGVDDLSRISEVHSSISSSFIKPTLESNDSATLKIKGYSSFREFYQSTTPVKSQNSVENETTIRRLTDPGLKIKKREKNKGLTTQKLSPLNLEIRLRKPQPFKRRLSPKLPKFTSVFQKSKQKIAKTPTFSPKSTYSTSPLLLPNHKIMKNFNLTSKVTHSASPNSLIHNKTQQSSTLTTNKSDPSLDEIQRLTKILLSWKRPVNN